MSKLIIGLICLSTVATAQVDQMRLRESIARANHYLNGLDDQQFDSYNLRLLYQHLAILYPQAVRPRERLLDFAPKRNEDLVIRDFYQGIIKKENFQNRDSLLAVMATTDGIERMLLWGTNANDLMLDSMTMATFMSYASDHSDVRGVAHAALAYHWASWGAPSSSAQLKGVISGYEAPLRHGAERHGVVSDDALEGMMGLVCIGMGHTIPMKWVDQIIRTQNPDGGWSWEKGDSKGSNPHTTLLALWCLAEVNRLSAPQLGGAVPHSRENVVNQWVDELIGTTKNTVGFVPPIVSRAIAYFGLTVYYGTHATDADVVAKLNRLQFSKQIPFKAIDEYPGKHKALLLNELCYQFMLLFYKNMPPDRFESALRLRNNIYERIAADRLPVGNEERERLAKLWADEMYRRSWADGSHDAFLKTFDNDYKAPECDSCWVRTPPSFFPAILPKWGGNIPMIPATQTVAEDMRPPTFGTDAKSPLFSDAMALYRTSLVGDTAIENIARYWNDDPGYSGTPSGHLLAIARQLIQKNELSLERSCEVYGMLGVALNEANILCWRLKYHYNFIRPATYIHRYIGKDFNASIPTPPFPEYPSGHSCLSGAGITVLQHFFPNEKDFTDRTNVDRVDIDGSPRTYTDLEAMKKEISISRWYGGIHFKETLDESVTIGERVAAEVIRILD